MLTELAMQRFVYPAYPTLDETNGGFVVTFADLPEAITQGEDTRATRSDGVRICQARPEISERCGQRLSRRPKDSGTSPIEPGEDPIYYPHNISTRSPGGNRPYGFKLEKAAAVRQAPSRA